MSNTVGYFPEMILGCAVMTEMDISPDKRQKAPQSSQPHKQQLISERQQRFMTQMLSKNGVWLFQSHIGILLCLESSSYIHIWFCEDPVLYALYTSAGGQKPDGDLSIAKAADKASSGV